MPPKSTTPPEGASLPLTIVLLNYNGGELLSRCIRSLAAQTVLPRRLLFVDNGSADYDERAIRAAFGPRFDQSLRCERLHENVGYVLGMNHGLGLAVADSGPDATEWVMTLSNDTELEPRFFELLSPELSSAPPVGMLAPKLRSAADRERLDGTGLRVSLDGMSTARGQRELDSGQYDGALRALCPNGVAAIYRADLLREIGLYDDQFWAYCEDTDLGLRAWLAGWECRFVPRCVVYHARSSTLGEHSLRKLYLVERNHFWVALKNFPLPLLALLPAFTSYRYLVQAWAVLSRTGQGEGYTRAHGVLELAAATARGVLDAGKGAPSVLRKRLGLAGTRRRALAEQLATLVRERLSFRDLILK